VITVSATLPASPAAVFDVLADGWSYAGWVVGATHVRDVDDGWPAVGTRIHHSVGPWPLELHDVTTVTAVDAPRLLELDARLSPVGAARIRLELAADGPERTTVRMSELVEHGPARLLPRSVQALVLIPRNRESLTRLGHLAAARKQNPQNLTPHPPNPASPPFPFASPPFPTRESPAPDPRVPTARLAHPESGLAGRNVRLADP
jgi:uncharacterized protein YndB with AHSA1/START domain